MRKNQQSGQQEKEHRSSTGSKLSIGRQSSVYRSGSSNPGIEFDLAKRAFVVRHVLVQDRRQRLSLLGTQIDALKIAHLNLVFRLLLHGPEHQEEIPDIDPHLHTIGIGLAVIGIVDDIKIRLRGNDHKPHSLSRIGVERKLKRNPEQKLLAGGFRNRHTLAGWPAFLFPDQNRVYFRNQLQEFFRVFFRGCCLAEILPLASCG